MSVGKTASLFLAAVGLLVGQPTYTDLLNQFPYRNLGPFRAGSPGSDSIAVAGQVAHVLRCRAHGAAFGRPSTTESLSENVTDSVGINSVGAVAVAPSDPRVVWVGSGDNTLTRSAYYGNGMYKSSDAGATWQHVGLEDTQHIARIVIHPTNPDVVWVAALGHLFSGNAERGRVQDHLMAGALGRKSSTAPKIPAQST